MTPIHEMKTRKATWVDPRHGLNHGVFFEVDGREVGVVIRDQSEAVAKPLIGAIAALPALVASLRAASRPDTMGCWCHHSRDTFNEGHTEACATAFAALEAIGALP